jgi:hypothetical protein
LMLGGRGSGIGHSVSDILEHGFPFEKWVGWNSSISSPKAVITYLTQCLRLFLLHCRHPPSPAGSSEH